MKAPKQKPSAAARCIVRCDFEASLFLVLKAGKTEWQYLDALPRFGIPADICALVADMGHAINELAPMAADMRAQGMIGHQQEILGQLDMLRSNLAQVLDNFCIPKEEIPRVIGGSSSSSSRQSWSVASIASELSSAHYCIVDNFVPASTPSLRATLVSMKESGALKPGEVSGGLRSETRGDLMKWVSTEAGEQPPALYALLSSIDDLVGALSRQPLLRDDLGGDKMLIRHEMQCTCYPGNGARYVRHVDDALAHRGRILTCIAYANPAWQPPHGGALRLHVKSGAKDIEPIDGRLILFWSDSRCPHEVLPAHRERYAVSVWFSDADALALAAKAEQRDEAAAQKEKEKRAR